MNESDCEINLHAIVGFDDSFSITTYDFLDFVQSFTGTD